MLLFIYTLQTLFTRVRSFIFVSDLGEEIQASARFLNVASRRYLWDVTYTADDYIAVLDTYSGHRTIVREDRERLYERIRRRIEARKQLRRAHLLWSRKRR